MGITVLGEGLGIVFARALELYATLEHSDKALLPDEVLEEMGKFRSIVAEFVEVSHE